MIIGSLLVCKHDNHPHLDGEVGSYDPLGASFGIPLKTLAC